MLMHVCFLYNPLYIYTVYLYKDDLGTARAPAQLYIMRIIRQIWLRKTLFYAVSM